MSEEEAFGFFWLDEELEESDKGRKECPKCGSKRFYWFEDDEEWRCLDCDYTSKISETLNFLYPIKL